MRVRCGAATLDGERVEGGDGAEVWLWHPVGAEPEEIAAWKRWLADAGIQQPFKQVYREVYTLTPDERRTATYSNRYAGHVLNQRPYHALAAVRGWRDPLRLDVDDTFPATSRDLPAYGLRAEFWVHGAVEDPGPDGAAYPRLTTDQVRFYPPDAPPHHCQAGERDYVQQTALGQQPVAPLPLTDVPLLVFSEVMRDLDLFVTTSTIANDPTWSDGGPAQPHFQYWHACGLGPLSQIAATRRDLLAGILPRLPIAARCRLDDRYLLVRGDLHEYRVHLATSQVLIGPHQRFLRLVLPPPYRLPDNLYLPVEDEMLALIVAKASLLADDTAITDPDVIRQLHDPH